MSGYDVVITPMVNSGLGWERSIEPIYREHFDDLPAARARAKQARSQHDQACIYPHKWADETSPPEEIY